MRKKEPEKKMPEEVKEPEPEQYFFDPTKETKKKRSKDKRNGKKNS